MTAVYLLAACLYSGLDGSLTLIGSTGGAVVSGGGGAGALLDGVAVTPERVSSAVNLGASVLGAADDGWGVGVVDASLAAAGVLFRVRDVVVAFARVLAGLTSAGSGSAFDFFVAAAVLFVDAALVVFFTTVAGASEGVLSADGSTFFLPLGFAAVVGVAVLVLIFFVDTLARSEDVESVALARGLGGLAAPEAYRRPWRYRTLVLDTGVTET